MDQLAQILMGLVAVTVIGCMTCELIFGNAPVRLWKKKAKKPVVFQPWDF